MARLAIVQRNVSFASRGEDKVGIGKPEDAIRHETLWVEPAMVTKGFLATQAA